MTDEKRILRSLGDFFWRLAVLGLLASIATNTAKDSEWWTGYVVVLFLAGISGLLVFGGDAK